MHARPRSRRTLDEVAFRPPRALGVIVGGAFAAWAAALAAVTATIAAGADAQFKTFLAWLATAVLVGVAVVFANWAYSVFRLAYLIDRTSLTIRWGFRCVVIPLDTIQRMLPGRTLDESRVEGLNWWGCHVGGADVKRLGYTLFYSTHSTPDELLYIVTTEESYALTVLDQAAFAEEVQARAAVSTIDQHPQRAAATGIAALPFWRDHAALYASGLSILISIVLCGYVYGRYPGLPEVIQLGFPALGGVVRVGAKSELLRIVYLAVGILSMNLILGVAVHARERAAGLWLIGSAGILQTILLAAAVLAIRSS